MSNFDLKWTLPTPTAKQRPLKHVLIEVRQVGMTAWTLVTTVPVPTTQLTIDIGPGIWEYRATVVDAADVKDPTGKIATVTVVATFDPPSTVGTFTITATTGPGTPTISVAASGPNAVTVTLLTP